MRRSELGRSFDAQKRMKRTRIRNTRERTPEEWDAYNDAKIIIWARAEGRCEARHERVCTETPDQRGPHHIIEQPEGPDTVENLLVVCPECHAWIDRNPNAAIARGWLKRPNRVTP